MSPLSRRALLLAAAALPALACSPAAHASIDTRANESRFANSPFRRLTPEQWRARLAPASFHILREEGTERPFTSPLLNEHRNGTFNCMGCGLPLFRSQWKFDSGTGWPSFYNVIETNVGARPVQDMLGGNYSEIHCAQCLGHLGHVFHDGPRPTGLRYCIDGVALTFQPG